MIRLRTDCLVFETTDGGVPCTVAAVIDELLGEATSWLDPEVLKEAAAGVLRYFQEELGRDTVTVDEFSHALARVLRGFGLHVVPAEAPASPGAPPSPVLDLQELACAAGGAFELAFFTRLRCELTRCLAIAPRVVRLRGLRACVKHLAAAQRWCPRCRRLRGQILSFLDDCLRETAPHGGCALVVS